MTQEKIALSIEEAADYTGIGRNTLRNLMEWKKILVLKVGKKGSNTEGCFGNIFRDERRK